MKADKDKINRLLKTASGQIDGILKMVEDNRYCIDICNQVMATESILHKINKEILRAHMESCVKDALSDSNEGKEKIAEIIAIVDKIAK